MITLRRLVPSKVPFLRPKHHSNDDEKSAEKRKKRTSRADRDSSDPSLTRSAPTDGHESSANTPTKPLISSTAPAKSAKQPKSTPPVESESQPASHNKSRKYPVTPHIDLSESPPTVATPTSSQDLLERKVSKASRRSRATRESLGSHPESQPPPVSPITSRTFPSTTAVRLSPSSPPSTPSHLRSKHHHSDHADHSSGLKPDKRMERSVSLRVPGESMRSRHDLDTSPRGSVGRGRAARQSLDYAVLARQQASEHEERLTEDRSKTLSNEDDDDNVPLAVGDNIPLGMMISGLMSASKQIDQEIEDNIPIAKLADTPSRRSCLLIGGNLVWHPPVHKEGADLAKKPEAAKEHGDDKGLRGQEDEDDDEKPLASSLMAGDLHPNASLLQRNGSIKIKTPAQRYRDYILSRSPDDANPAHRNLASDNVAEGNEAKEATEAVAKQSKGENEEEDDVPLAAATRTRAHASAPIPILNPRPENNVDDDDVPLAISLPDTSLMRRRTISSHAT
ncbi:uncharacterized protein VTP21DRAFT_4803 [Calcarisporiella thermophila]|uniref:uncharacterized protein n=1 Tax=Calcarisporiella thermophila TaxID=911321 RepID=UPI00374293E8